MDNGAHIESRDHLGRTPLWFAAANGRTDVVRALVSAEADVNTQHNDGAKYMHLEDERADPVRTLHSGRFEYLVYTLLKHGADVYNRDYDNMLPIDIASYNGHADIVEFLTSCDRPTVALRCSNLHLPLIAVDVDYRRNTAVHLTTDLQAMISLLENGADVEAENVDGLRPIHCAVRTGCVELVELLINHGANFDAADVFGNRPLHEAVCHGLRVVQLLVQRGANLNVQDINGKTPRPLNVSSLTSLCSC